MTAENTAENSQTVPTQAERFVSLAEIDAQQDEVLRRLDELDDEILKLTDDFRIRLKREQPDAEAA